MYVCVSHECQLATEQGMLTKVRLNIHASELHRTRQRDNSCHIMHQAGNQYCQLLGGKHVLLGMDNKYATRLSANGACRGTIPEGGGV